MRKGGAGILLLMAWAMIIIPGYGYGQNRQRAKNKTKTTVPASGSSKTSRPQTSAEAKKQQENAQREVQLAQQQIRENDAKVSRGLTELGKLNNEIDKTKVKIKELNGKLNRLSNEISSLEGSIRKNEDELSRLRGEYLKAVKRMRVTKKNKSMLAFIFSSKSMSEAMRRMRYLREFSAWRDRQTEEINARIIDLKHEREALSKAREEQQNALALQKSSEAKLAASRSRQEVVIAELRQNGKALESHLKQKQAEAKELGNIVSQLIAEEQKERERIERERLERERREQERLLAEEAQRAAQSALEENPVDKEPAAKKRSDNKNSYTYQKPNKDSKDKNTDYASARKRTPRGNAVESTAKSSTESPATSTVQGFPGMKGRLPSPSTGSFNITSRFGRQEIADLPGVEYDNPGIDAESDAGASARAVYEGKVSGVYLLPGYNTVVIVNHGNYYTVYGNIASPAVKTGDTVDAGSHLGQLAMSDDGSGHSSIHFEVWRNREKLNPQEWLR